MKLCDFQRRQLKKSPFSVEGKRVYWKVQKAFTHTSFSMKEPEKNLEVVFK